MYKGNNPIAIKSQHMMLDSLNRLLSEKEYKDISISEICEHSGISRQTFYKLFGSKEDLMLFRLENFLYARQDTEDDKDSLNLTEICRRFSIYIVANYSQFQMLLENDLMSIFYTQLYKSMSTCRHSFVDLNNNEQEYAAQFIASGLCRLTQKYILDHDTPDQNELFNLSYRIMSGSIYKI